ncbi:DUF6879 family protein [Streptomyces sp. NPDC021224]|uniref:DUF6879 family protein n=1 Tax=unclassified Streptomyces TaxID=2593676 RepID=UPI003799AA37
MQPPAREGLANAVRSAIHLELRDSYMLDDPGFAAFQQGHRLHLADRGSWWNGWHDAVAAAVARGVTVRRARVVSEPLHPYGLYEYDLTPGNLEAGEEVRWLGRRQAVGLLLPATDFWVFDDNTVLFHHFTGEGQLAADGREYRTDPAMAKTLGAVFGAVWERATPHTEYTPAT